MITVSLEAKIMYLAVAHACNQLLRRQRSGGSRLEASLGKQFVRPYLENTQPKKGSVEWLKVV
jgi:hypothetical protein